MNSTEYLELIDKYDCYVLFEKGAPRGTLKRDLISLRTQDGKALDLHTSTGYHVCPVHLDRATFDYFISASFLKQAALEDSQGRIIFRLTPDGQAFAKTGKAA
jgi:hypothetical protein